MESSIPWGRAVLTALLAAGTALWGWYGWLIIVWVCAMALDYITGSLAAAKRRTWSSAKARQGLYHKLGSIVAVLVSVLLDVLIRVLLRGTQITLPVEVRVVVSPLVIGWYTLTELGSVLENAVRLGARVPGWLTRILKITADAVDQAGDGITK